MKVFFQSLLASLVAFILIAGLGVLALIGIAAAMAPSGPTVPKHAILVFDLSTNIPDSNQDGSPSELLQKAINGSDGEGTPLLSLIRAIDRAARDKDIAALYLTGNLRPEGYGAGYGALAELKEALRRFKTSGKPVIAYNQGWTKREYYLCASSDNLYVNPMGELELTAPQADMIFYAGLFKKYGIECQVTRVGKYKSAVEPYLLEKMSPENREQYEKLLGDLWSEWKTSVAADRKMKSEDLQRIADEKGLVSPLDAQKAGLVDKLAYGDQVLDELKRLSGRSEKDQDFPQIDLADYAKLGGDAGSGGRVAIAYAEGTIVDGEGNGTQLGGDRLAQELRRLRLDNNVKAVVLRVNSPGGSAVASDVIQREVIALKKVKPVVVSMGTVAASGGYWISTYASRIFAEPSTLTGSIGVFGVLPNARKLANDHGVTFDGVQLGKLALPSLVRPASPEELGRVQAFVDEIYDQFLHKVAEGRKLPKAAVHEIAQGRVWSGKEALKLGLVDELGGLEDATRAAAKLAGLGTQFRLDAPEAPRTPAEKLLKMLSNEKRKQAAGLRLNASGRTDATLGVGSRIKRGVEQQIQVLDAFNDPHGVYALMPFEATIR